jgi:O-antigen/teichoic acid export membrane protein
MAGGASFATNVLSTLTTRVLLVVISILTGVLTARVLGPHDRGLLSLLLTLAATLAVLFRLGIYSANIYAIRHEKKDPSAVGANSIVFALGLGLTAVSVVALASGALRRTILRDVDLLLLMVAVAAVPLELLVTYFRGILHAFQRFGADNLRTLAGAVLSLAGAFVALVVLDVGLLGVLLVALAVTALMALVLGAYVRTTCGRFGRADLALSRFTLAYGIKSYFQTLASYLHHRVDIYLLALWVSPAQVAFYSIGTRLAELILLAPEAAGQVFFPKATALETDAERSRQTATVLRHVVAVTATIAIALWLVGARLIVGVYGPTYADAAAPFALVLPGVVMTSLFTITNRDLMARGKQGMNIACNVTALVLNVGLNLLLIPRWGIQGAAVASTVSYSCAAVVLLGCFMRESGYGFRQIFQVQRSDVLFYMRLVDRWRSRARRLLRAQPPAEPAAGQARR